MNTLKAEKRSTDEKAKKLRREGFVTGNLFGREMENSIMLKLLKKDVEQLLKVDNKGSQVMLEVDGKQYDALIKEIQYNAMARRVDEIDFQALVSNEKVHSVAEVILVNADKVASGVVQEGLSEIAYKALPAALVDKVKVDVGHMKVGDTLRVKDLEIANDQDVDLSTDPEAVVVTVTAVHNIVPETTTEETEEA
jgi:large subunit ribosomal protein L25